MTWRIFGRAGRAKQQSSERAESREPDLEAVGDRFSAPRCFLLHACCGHARRYGRNHLHVRRDSRPERCGADSRQRAREYRPGRKRNPKYKKYGRPFFPIRFLNLLPLSHMFGQAMATFVPPMLEGTVIFMRGYNPHEIVRQIKKRRVSVLVSVPKILDVLADHVTRLHPEVREVPAGKEHVARRWWRYRAIHRLFGLKFWSFVVGAAPLETSLESFWGRLGFRRRAGIRPDRNSADRDAEPSVLDEQRVGRQAHRRRQHQDRRRRRNSRARRKRDKGVLRRSRGASAFEDGWFHTGDIGELDEGGRLFIRGRKKEMIVTPEGLNVFPEDVERVVNAIAGRQRVGGGRRHAERRRASAGRP